MEKQTEYFSLNVSTSPDEVAKHLQKWLRQLDGECLVEIITKFHTSIASLAFNAPLKWEHGHRFCWNWGKNEMHVLLLIFTVFESSFQRALSFTLSHFYRFFHHFITIATYCRLNSQASWICELSQAENREKYLHLLVAHQHPLP